MSKFVILRDPVHGDIELTPTQVAVLDTPELQRLRGIKQLGAAYLVYPGCMHTRFEHSLGTLATAMKIVAALRRAGHAVHEDDANIIGVAALCHDVAHMPFGHTLEDERGLFPRHDQSDRLRTVLCGGNLGQVLRELGILESVVHMLTIKEHWRSQIIAGSIDADLLDYLRRDSYYSGISQDYDDRVYQYFFLADGQLAINLAKRGMDRPDARSEVLHLLRMRYFLTERVYLHHAKMAAGTMISKAVELYLDTGLSMSTLVGLTDEGLLSRLTGQWGGQTHPEAAQLAFRVLTRRLYKRAYGLSGAQLPVSERQRLSDQFHSSREERDALARRIAARAGVPEYSVLVHCTGELPFRELTIPSYTRYGLHPLNCPPSGVASAPDIRALETDYQALWRLWVFAPEEYRTLVAGAAQREVGFDNELRG